MGAAADDGAIDAALRALAHPRRRAILHLVADREHSPSDIAEACGLTRPATSQHLTVLRAADLVSVRPVGAGRRYRARRERLAEIARELDLFWGDRLDRLRSAVAEEAKGDPAT